MPTDNRNYLGEYTRLKSLGSGSFADIHKVRHNRFGYIRAVKVSKARVLDPESREYMTFLKECSMLLRIGNGCHPNIVRIYKPDLKDDCAFVEMDYIEGLTLNEYISKIHFLEIDEVFRFIREIVGALAFCHHDIYRFLMDPAIDQLQTDPNDGSSYIIDETKRRELVDKYKVIHNDLHSNNVMRRNYDGSFVLLDFGLSIQDGQCVKSSSRDNGAVEYKAPEKWHDDCNISTQSDIYSIGILMYEVLAGQVPFKYDRNRCPSDMAAQIAVYEMHLNQLPPSVFEIRKSSFEKAHPEMEYTKDYPDWLESVILKCLEKEPENRYADARELMDDIMLHLDMDSHSEKERIDKLNSELTRIQSMQAASEQENANLLDINDRLKKSLKEAENKSGGSRWKTASAVLAAALAGLAVSNITGKSGDNDIIYTTEATEAPEVTEVTEVAEIAEVTEPVNSSDTIIEYIVQTDTSMVLEYEKRIGELQSEQKRLLSDKEKEISQLKRQLNDANEKIERYKQAIINGDI